MSNTRSDLLSDIGAQREYIRDLKVYKPANKKQLATAVANYKKLKKGALAKHPDLAKELGRNLYKLSGDISMNNGIIKSMSQELNGMICYGGLFEKIAKDTSSNTAGSVAGTIAGAALGLPVSSMVDDWVSTKVPKSRALPFLAGTAALYPFAAAGSAAGRKIQKEHRRTRREDMIMRDLLKDSKFRASVAKKLEKDKLKKHASEESNLNVIRRALKRLLGTGK